MSIQVAQPPRATYRVQMHPGFGFDAAADIAGYLNELGISHLYSSPYLQAGKGSTHGYDVIDHSRVNAELGGFEAHARFCRVLGENHLGQVLDVVPNHMSIAESANRWWWDVLENGPASRYASYFDVDWQFNETKLHNTVLLPILGDQYGRVLEAGEIKLERRDGAFVFCYADHTVPVAPRSIDSVLGSAAARCESDTLAFLAEAFGRLPLSTVTDAVSLTRRHRDKEVLRSELARFCQENPGCASAIDKVVGKINSSPDELHELLDRQNYRLAFWRTAGQELDYRRFFDINTLISLRMEDEKVFFDTHALVLDWLRRGVLDGVRVDHPDGLRDPEGYFARLHQSAPQAWIVAEKILDADEQLPETWSVSGTTGYDFINLLAGVFISCESEGALSEFYTEFTGESTDYEAMVREKKLLVLRDLFGSDLNRGTAFLASVCERHRRFRDYTRRELHIMLREVIACFPVYRTYVQAEVGRVSNEDLRYINAAVDAAKAAQSELDPALFDFFRDTLLLKVRGELESELVMRFQQSTGPVMAKGVEDTAFYNFNRFVALNEVGGAPNRFGSSPAEFHEACKIRLRTWPQSMLASTTHDTKRSEDVRARLWLLSEIPDKWRQAAQAWAEHNEGQKCEQFPDRNAEYLFYQTLVGAWPLDVERAVAYMLKAAREAKSFTSWTSPKPVYEEALEAFVRGVLEDGEFVEMVAAFVKPLVAPGRVNSLSQALVKLIAPGVPDIYQGTELWDLSLVDPDNRRPVDYSLRRRLLEELEGLSAEQIMARSDEGLPKLWLTRQTLRLRRQHPQWFGAESTYEGLVASGPQADHVLAIARSGHVVGVVPRLVLGIDRWQNTTLKLPEGAWQNELTGEKVRGGEVAIADLLEKFPVALLHKTS